MCVLVIKEYVFGN